MYSDYYDSIGKVAETDKEVADAMALELKRQRDNIELIASENLVSPQVMAAMGSVLTNKYAEGLPAKRYYGGCQYVDIVENIAIKRACELFKCNFANVQPHSGAQANTAVYLALLKPGDTVMGMSLDNGGHLTHGSPANISGKYFNFVPYGVDENGFIDYKEFAKQVNKVIQRREDPGGQRFLWSLAGCGGYDVRLHCPGAGAEGIPALPVPPGYPLFPRAGVPEGDPGHHAGAAV
mgnify:CR=1 FL=1